MRRVLSYWLPTVFLLLVAIALVCGYRYGVQKIATMPVGENLVLTEIELVKTLAQIALGALVVGTIYVAWRRVEVAKEGQITERFTRAIDQLGSEKMAIRLGGIYALERIAKDSEKDHWQVMEVLAAYVRENSPSDWSPGTPQAFSPIPFDIQAILEVLGRRNTEYENPKQRLNLRMTDLRAAELEGADFRRADFRLANLHNVYFKDADLSEAKLFQANIENASLEGTDLRGANLGVLWNWTQSQLDSAVTDEKTNFPEGYTTRGK